VICVENRIQGTVREAIDALFKENVHIIGELKISIHHCIATQKGSKLSDIRAVMSHPQALNQSSDYLRRKLPNVKWITANSTAAAFEHVHKNRDNSIAAIGPEPAAKHYELKILDKQIENYKSNETRFVIITKNAPKKVPTKNAKTSIIFYFSKDKAGSLFSVFKIFNDLGLNLAHIESRPAPRKLGEYLFYLDFEGSRAAKKGAEAIKRVREIVGGLKVLGTY